MLKEIWEFEIQVLPIIVALLVFEIPAAIRKLKRLYYVPIYFSLFPFSVLNEDLSIYLGEDDFYDTSERMSEKELESLRRKIITISIISMAIGAVLTPLFTEFVGAFFLTHETLLQFVFVLIAVKSIAIYKSLVGFKYHALSSRRNQVLLGFIYICYLGVVVEMIRSAYWWAFPYVETSRWRDLLSDLSSLVFGKVIVQGLVFTLLVALFVSFIADRKLRQEDDGQDS